MRNRPNARPCRACTGTTINSDRICRPCKRKVKPSQTVECSDCGGQTRRVNERVCKDCSCRYEALERDFGSPDPTYALRGGEWVTNPRGVQVWAPYGQEVEGPPRRDEVAIRRRAAAMAAVFEGLTEMADCAYEGCANRYEVKHSRRHYCSKKCKDAAYYQRRQAREEAA
ncbi:MAG: hypothetical protein ACRDTJ_03990 [Pseudonocardiaceae bacterium]